VDKLFKGILKQLEGGDGKDPSRQGFLQLLKHLIDFVVAMRTKEQLNK